MSDRPPRKISRRKLIGGAAAATASIPVLHELVPHQVLHDQLAQAAGEHGAHQGMDMSNVHAAAGVHKGSAHSGAVGSVDPKVNGFDPHEILRDFDTGTVTRE